LMELAISEHWEPRTTMYTELFVPLETGRPTRVGSWNIFCLPTYLQYM
jgi:hypothetical protein